MTDDYPMAHKVKRPQAWISAADHEKDSTAFRARQMARIAAANAERERRKFEENVTQLRKKK